MPQERPFPIVANLVHFLHFQRVFHLVMILTFRVVHINLFSLVKYFFVLLALLANFCNVCHLFPSRFFDNLDKKRQNTLRTYGWSSERDDC